MRGQRRPQDGIGATRIPQSGEHGENPPFDLAEYGGTPDPATAVRNALAKMKLERALVIGVETDILFPLEQQQQLADDLRATGTDTAFVGLDSPQGHDAFLVDTGRFGAAIGAFMASL